MDIVQQVHGVIDIHTSPWSAGHNPTSPWSAGHSPTTPWSAGERS